MIVKRLIWFFSMTALSIASLIGLLQADFMSAKVPEEAITPSNTPPVAAFTVDPASGEVALARHHR